MTANKDRSYFRFLGYCWDVTTALELAAASPVERLDTKQFYPWLRVISINKRHAAHVDLDDPVLLARIGDSGTTMLIDGWHRLHRARAEGLTGLPCRVLNEKRELQARIVGGSLRRRGPGRTPRAVSPKGDATADHWLCPHSNDLI
ncbi:hypothetical protein [Streptomyces sp. NPDC054865]